MYPGGATVERELPNTLDNLPSLRLALRSPDFTTANRIEQAINAKLGPGSANAADLGTVDVRVPVSYQHRVTALMAQIERIEVRPDMPARVVIDEKSGTIVVGAEVKLDAVGGAWQPDGSCDRGASGQPTWAVLTRAHRGTPNTQIDVNDHAERNLQIMKRSATLKDLVDGLNALGLGPRDLIQVLNALKAAGALHADLEFI